NTALTAALSESTHQHGVHFYGATAGGTHHHVDLGSAPSSEGSNAKQLRRKSSARLTHYQPQRSHEASHWNWRHLLQSQRRESTAGLIPATRWTRCTSMECRLLRLDG